MDYRQVILDYQQLKKDIAPNLVRQVRGSLSYGKFALQLGCERSYLWKIEHRTELINDDLLLKILEMM
jgi:hypothetical protein